MNSILEARRNKFVQVGTTDKHYKRRRISSSSDAVEVVKDLLSDYFDNLPCEEFLILTMDTKNQVEAVVKIMKGTLDASLVHPREVFRPAIMLCASSIILVHNHPSGDPTPSREDIAVTTRLTDCGKTLGVDVLDHIVYGCGEFSFFGVDEREVGETVGERVAGYCAGQKNNKRREGSAISIREFT